MASGDFVALDPCRFVGEVDGKPVALYTIANDRGMAVRLVNLGCKIEQIVVPDRQGRLGDVVLGYDSLDALRAGQTSMGAFIGRYANRIANGRFTLDGKAYELNRNSGPNTLHGGAKGSRFVVFDAEPLGSSSVRMQYTFKDGEENFPGNLETAVTYTVTEENALELSWHAATDRRTVASFTDHSFFNLAGGGSVLDHVLSINAERFTPVNENSIPTGELRPVAGTPFDFRTPMAIGARIGADDPQLKLGNGYDHNFVLDKRSAGELCFAARLADPTSGRVLEVWTTEPGLQLYSGNNLAGEVPRDVGKGGRVYRSRDAVCLEAQRLPDSPNQPGFPPCVVDPGTPFTGKIVYRFSVAAG
ncbi:MAG TPA: aldose epimerase family protein [Pseudolabrys sp.]|nr:aldose epimerase family protein [Pseudolabrys sp.]